MSEEYIKLGQEHFPQYPRQTLYSLLILPFDDKQLGHWQRP
jgi:hypothetical protein